MKRVSKILRHNEETILIAEQVAQGKTATKKNTGCLRIVIATWKIYCLNNKNHTRSVEHQIIKYVSTLYILECAHNHRWKTCCSPFLTNWKLSVCPDRLRTLSACGRDALLVSQAILKFLIWSIQMILCQSGISTKLLQKEKQQFGCEYLKFPNT